MIFMQIICLKEKKRICLNWAWGLLLLVHMSLSACANQTETAVNSNEPIETTMQLAKETNENCHLELCAGI